MYKIATYYFPLFIVYVVSPISLLAGIYFFTEYPVWGVVAVVFSIVFATTRYITAIDLPNKEYSDYLFFLGFKLNKDSGKFQYLEKIVITKGDHAYKASSRSSDRTVQFTDFSATLIFLGEHKLSLLTDTDKHTLLKKIKGLAEFLSIEVEDQSVKTPYIIDIAKV